jgi:carbon starvation protein
VTFTAGLEKIFHPDPRIGFLAQARQLEHDLADLTTRRDLAAGAVPHGLPDARSNLNSLDAALARQHALIFNSRLDAAVAAAFLGLVSLLVGLSLREWYLLLTRRKAARLQEAEPVWLPEYALREPGPNWRSVAGAAGIALGLARELSGETQFERARQQACVHQAQSLGDHHVFARATEERFNGVRRCC